MLGGEVERMRREAWAQALEIGKKQDQKIAENLRAANEDGARPSSRPGAARGVFQGRRRGRAPRRRERPLTTNGLCEKLPALEDDLRREQDRLDVLRERRRAALTLERSAALFVVARSILATFARMKAERGALDFNDQIARALTLVTRSSAAWVLHKLDYGLDHLLLDEAQDASEPQWGILAALSAEFFAGAGARPKNRTVFAVGDEKQSIFAFQGAAPEMFAEMKRAFAERHRESKRPFADVPADLLVPLVADDSRRRRHDLPNRTGVARRRSRRGAAAQARGDSPRLERRGRTVAADRAEPRRRTRKTGACRSIRRRRTTPR